MFPIFARGLTLPPTNMEVHRPRSTDYRERVFVYFRVSWWDEMANLREVRFVQLYQGTSPLFVSGVNQLWSSFFFFSGTTRRHQVPRRVHMFDNTPNGSSLSRTICCFMCICLDPSLAAVLFFAWPQLKKYILCWPPCFFSFHFCGDR